MTRTIKTMMAAWATLLPLSAVAQKPILIGEISSYSTVPAFTIPYRNGWQLAVEEVNAAGGLLGGRKLEVISRDDAGKPDDAVRHANELVSSQKVDLLAGAFLSNVRPVPSSANCQHGGALRET